MRTTDEEIRIEVDEIRDSGYFGELHIAPIIAKKCFVQCSKGRCNCFPTVGEKYCIVTDDFISRAQKDFLNELSFLEKKINKV